MRALLEICGHNSEQSMESKIHYHLQVILVSTAFLKQRVNINILYGGTIVQNSILYPISAQTVCIEIDK